MSDIKEELNYYKADEFLDKYIKGEMNIHNSIQLKNRTQTTIYHVSFLHHLLYLCKTTKTNLLTMLNKFKEKIETFIRRLIKENFYIRTYIESIIKEWSLLLEPENIFNSMNETFSYDEFINHNKIYNELIGGMKGLEQAVQNKEYSLDGDIKDTLLLLYTNCTDCKEKINMHIQKLIHITSELEPTYNYLLLDLSNKAKPNYLEMVDEANKNSTIFSRLLNTSSDQDIPKHINTIFLNYIMIINMLKKEYHFIITTLKTINKNLEQRYISLDGLMKGLNLKNQPNDIDTLDDISTDSDFDDTDIDYSISVSDSASASAPASASASASGNESSFF